MGRTGDDSRAVSRQAESAGGVLPPTDSYSDEWFLGRPSTASDNVYYDPRVEHYNAPSNQHRNPPRRRRRRPSRRVIIRRRIQAAVMAGLFVWLVVSVGGWIFSGHKAVRHTATNPNNATAAYGPTPQEANAPAAPAAPPPPPPPPPPSTPAGPGASQCAGTAPGSQHLVVNITDQWLWACNGSNLVNSSAVTTASAQHRTPLGNFHVGGVYGQQILHGCDNSGCWNDHVNVWVPFLGNSVGFHDAPWQTMPFGNPGYRVNGSHGCVHLPETEAHWVASWVRPGALVTITA